MMQAAGSRHNNNNPAAAQGWVQSVDPQSGRVFYANHITRKTQWEPPAGWVDTPKAGTTTTPAQEEDDDGPLPDNWEVMRDPTTGKPFYVDHGRKITTWTRPKADKKVTTQQPSLRPAVATPPASSGRNNGMSRLLAQQQQQYGSWDYHGSSSRGHGQNYHHQVVDFSDALPKLDFTVQTVPDSLRPCCPSCEAPFTMSKRRHHCRLCGDVFCDACSNHRETLPLEGPEFAKGPVRICDFCYKDVQHGNYFALRRYWTPLHLYDPEHDMQDDAVATPQNVNAALSALTSDLTQMVQNPDGDSFETKVTMPADLLVPEILKHLRHDSTANYAIACVASLLAVESINGKNDFAVAVYLYGKRPCFENILALLERSGSDRKTLYVQEEAARVLFYLTESRLVMAVVREQAERHGSYYDEVNRRDEEFGSVESLEISRAFPCVLDHASNAHNPNLQRWSASCIKNFVLEDQRRACLAINDVAALVASGEEVAGLEYESYLDELINTGGVMILTTLIGTEDNDTRAHAVGALGALLSSTRAVDASMEALHEMTGGQAGRLERKDGNVVRAIVAGGGCAAAVAQLLLSADHGVASMGGRFLSSLVLPLLMESELSAPLPTVYDYRKDDSGAGACREAAIEIATGSCLPALLSIAREGKGVTRPIELRKMAMETLASVTSSIGEMGKSWAQGLYEEGLEKAGAPSKVKESILLLNEEGTIDVALEALQSSTGQSLGSSAKETPATRIRECAAIVIGSLSLCSADAILELQKRQILSSLLIATNDGMMGSASTLRGDEAPRSLGIVDAAAAILMFTWQHPSGASSELLDRLIEVVDAGVIPYLSKIINVKVEWESQDKSIGAMRARTAALKLLCCLFGIVLTDDTGIGLRRLMDAVDMDARAYRGGERAPSNIVESALGTLQTSSSHARKAIVGATNFGVHYQSALMDLVDASLLAAGSMCGSSVAPGGSEGTMITGDSFLQQRSDAYVARRKEICKVACDVVVRGSRTGPALLPTMLVGGFGEPACLASLRLCLAIAQNGTSDQHAKLAMSGILVPISDSLRAALTKGDLYKFSAALALVRFCGPHVAAGQGGGLESIRDAIKVATNVLTLPINPNARLEELETQENLKAECIAALESLSRNASLWSSISTEALPSVVRYLQATASSSLASKNPKTRETRCAALRAVLQIVQVPSHAVAAADCGLAEPLGALLHSADIRAEGDDVPMLALEVLHAMAKNQQARKKLRLLDQGLVRSICSALGKSTTSKPNKPSDSRADVAFLGLEILHFALADIEEGLEIQFILSSDKALAYLDSVTSELSFVKALCATVLVKTNMRLVDSSERGTHVIPSNYGDPLILVQEQCAGYADTHKAAAAMLRAMSVYASAIDSKRSEDFWSTALLQNDDHIDSDTSLKLAATFCAHYLELLANDYAPFLPLDTQNRSEFVLFTRPLVQHRLLEGLRDSMYQLTESVGADDEYLNAVVRSFNLPHICLSLWSEPALLELSFDVIKQIVDRDPEEVLHLFVAGKAPLFSLFDLLNQDGDEASAKDGVQSFLASILGQLAETGLLAEGVARFDLRTKAISALAFACLKEEERPGGEDEDTTSNRLSNILMRCLVNLCSVDRSPGTGRKVIRLDAPEAIEISRNLGQKLCHMVLSRFLERAKLQQYEIDEDESIMDAPDVAMLCAVAQHPEALANLRSVGGLHALSMVAAEGELEALEALKSASDADATILLEDDAYVGLLSLLAGDATTSSWKHDALLRSQLEETAFRLLSSLCFASVRGRNSVADNDNCEECVHRAMEVITSLAGLGEVPGADPVPTSDDDSSEDGPFATGSDDEAAVPPPYEAVPQPAKGVGTSSNQEGEALAIAVCLFLASVVPTTSGRKALVEDTRSVNTLANLCGGTSSAQLRYAALKVATSLAPYASSEGSLSTSGVSEVLLAALTSKEKVKTAACLNAFLMLDTAVGGILVVFDSLPTETQRLVAQTMADHFRKCIKACTVVRVVTKEADRAHAAELAYNLTVALILCRGKNLDGVFSHDLMTACCQLIQWRVDPKTSLGEMNARAWDAAVANAALLLSLVVWRPEEALQRDGIDVAKLAETTVMLARPGKAPRKAIDLQAALERLAAGPDGAGAMAARKVASRLF